MKLKKLRNALLVVLTLALVSATAVAATWAVVNHASENSKVNTFTTPNLALEIGEDKWDAKDYGSDTAEPVITEEGDHKGKIELPYSKDGNNPIYMAPDELGESLAQKYNPDQAIVKNPSLKNTSNVATPTEFMSGITNNEWVGMKVDYRVKAHDGSAYTLYKITGTGDNAVAQLITSTEFVDNDNNETLTTGTGNTKWYSFPTRTAFETAIAQIGDSATVAPSFTSKIFSAPAASNDANTWVTNDPNGQKFYYTSVISPEGNTYGEGDVALPCTTTNLFEYVHIKKDWTSTEAKIKTGDTVATAKTTFYEIMTVNGTKYYATSLPEFDIVLKGYAVQADEVTWANAPTALSDLMANN